MRRFTSSRSRHILLVHPGTDPQTWQVTTMDGELAISRMIWESEGQAVKSALGMRICGRPPAGDTSYREEVAHGQSALGWVEHLRAVGQDGFEWAAFREHFGDLCEQDAVALLWCHAGRLWSWGGDRWIVR